MVCQPVDSAFCELLFQPELFSTAFPLEFQDINEIIYARAMEGYQPFTFVGIALIIIGIVLVALPFIARHMPSLEKLPWIIVWVYKSNGFIFATLPLLIILTIISLILSILKR